MKRCRTCGKTKPLDDFQVMRSSRDGRNGKCRECCKAWYRENASLHKARVRARNDRVQEAMRARIAEYLQENPCVDCGEQDVRCLEFDHRPGEVKVESIAILVRNVVAWSTLEDEIAKCDVRCASCHRRVTAERGGQWRQAVHEDDIRQAHDQALARLARLLPR